MHSQKGVVKHAVISTDRKQWDKNVRLANIIKILAEICSSNPY